MAPYMPDTVLNELSNFFAFATVHYKYYHLRFADKELEAERG